MAKILVVCSGNTCRSPVVEGLLKNRLAQRGFTDWEVNSAGTRAKNGLPATQFGVQSLREAESIDIGDHRSSRISTETVANHDFIICMTHDHQNEIAALNTGYRPVHLLTDFSDKSSGGVTDPYGGDKEDYEKMVRLVGSLVDEGITKIIEMANLSALS